VPLMCRVCAGLISRVGDVWGKGNGLKVEFSGSS
jgi:hypothetical protein